MIERFNKIFHTLMGIKPRPPKRNQEKPIYANFQDRLFASAVDVTLLFLVFQDLFTLMSRYTYRDFNPHELHPDSAPISEYAPFTEQVKHYFMHMIDSGFAALWLENSFYQSIIIGVALVTIYTMFHTTPGKYLIGLNVVDKNTFENPSLKQYIKRYIGFYLSMPPFMLGFATLGFYKQNQAWHDMLAGTVVIYNKEGSVFHRLLAWLKIKLRKPPSNDN